MRTLGITVLTVGLAASIVAPARAQGFRGRMGTGGYMLLNERSVQRELKLDPKQIETMTIIVEEASAKAREKAIDIPDEDRAEKVPPIYRAANAEIKAAVKDLLKPEQIVRLEQISRQQQGLAAFSEPEIQEKLHLTGDQKTRLGEISEKSSARMREIFSNAGDRQAAMQKIATLRRESLEASIGLLTPDQKTLWKEMTGEPFDLPIPSRRPR